MVRVPPRDAESLDFLLTVSVVRITTATEDRPMSTVYEIMTDRIVAKLEAGIVP
jgi:hypothetical protein